MGDGVHRTHCCVLHGCKYGDEDCPVWNKKIKQDYPCEECGWVDEERKARRKNTEMIAVEIVDAVVPKDAVIIEKVNT